MAKLKTPDKQWVVFYPLLILLGGCSNSYEFGAGNASEPAVVEPTIEEPNSEDIVVEENQPEETETTQVLETYSYGEADPAIDYLFVIDNSSSMFDILSTVNAGFTSLQQEGVFPANSQIAVMTTMIADPSDFTMPSAFVTEYNGINLEPGFLDFVNKDAIDDYKFMVPGYADRWAIDGCQQSWFKPEDTNANGESCLSAAIQSTFSSLGVEAGIHAVQQLLLKRAGAPSFRDDSLVNIIFVSDTHDPGLPSQELVDTMPSYEDIRTLSEIDNTIKSLKFHALAPLEQCTGEGVHDHSYYKLVDQSQGQKADSCQLNNYQEFLMKMVESSKIADPQFKLGYSADLIVKVEVNGVEMTEFAISENGEYLIIETLNPSEPVEVVITYEMDVEPEA